MEDILEQLLCNGNYTLRNESNMREISASLNTDGWCVFENGDSMNEILDTEDIYEALDCLNFED